MIQICGERLSRRLGHRMNRVSHSISVRETLKLCTRWTKRIEARVQRIVFSFFRPKNRFLVVMPSFLERRNSTKILCCTSTRKKMQERSVLFVGAVFALFVSIFYQAAKEPVRDRSTSCFVRDELKEDGSFFFLSLLLLGLNKSSCTLSSLFDHIFVMEKSYV